MKNTISSKELETFLENYSVIIIDVRSEQEYREGHLNGAINIPLFEIRRKISNMEINKSQLIVVYCSAGIRSMKALNILNSLGYKNVYNYVYSYE